MEIFCGLDGLEPWESEQERVGEVHYSWAWGQFLKNDSGCQNL